MYDLRNRPEQERFFLFLPQKCYNEFMDYQTVKSAHEAYRKKSTRVYTIGIIITVLLTLVGIGSGSFFFGFFLLFLAYGSTAVFAAVYTKNEHKAYRQAYKAYFVEKNLRKILQ